MSSATTSPSQAPSARLPSACRGLRLLSAPPRPLRSSPRPEGERARLPAMSFAFEWPEFSESFYADAREMLAQVSFRSLVFERVHTVMKAVGGAGNRRNLPESFLRAA